MKNADSKEFLRLIGYEGVEIKKLHFKRETRKQLTPQQTAFLKAKVDSFKATEEWARKEKANATRQLEQITNESKREQLQDSIQYFDQT